VLVNCEIKGAISALYLSASPNQRGAGQIRPRNANRLANGGILPDFTKKMYHGVLF
jgi:hypothetical protein